MEHCNVCGAVTACPKNYFNKAIPAEVHYHKIGEFCPECKGGKVTHRRPKRGVWLVVCPPPEKGWRIHIAGTRGNARVQTHFNVLGVWCGACSYALWVAD